jgi:hypothetical protein
MAAALDEVFRAGRRSKRTPRLGTLSSLIHTLDSRAPIFGEPLLEGASNRIVRKQGVEFG